jgi:hypothetical protein
VLRITVKVQSSNRILSDVLEISQIFEAVRRSIAKEIGLPSKNFHLGKLPQRMVLMRDDIEMSTFVLSLDLKVKRPDGFVL